MARSFSTLFFKAAKSSGRIQRAALNRGRARRLRQARRRVAPGGGQARRQCLARRRLALAGLGRWRPRASSPTAWAGVSPRPLHSARRAAPGHAAGGHAARLSPDRAVVRAGFAHEPVADAAGFMVLYPQQSMARQVQRCWRWFQPDALHGGGEADLIAALVRSEVGRHGLDPTRVHRRPVGGRRHGGSCGAAASATGGGAGHAFRPGDGRRAPPRPANHAPGRARPASAAGKRGQSGSAAPGHAGHHPAGQLDPAVAPRNARQLFDQFRLLNGLHPQDVPVERVLGLGTDKSYRRVDMLKDRRAVVRLCEITHVEHAWSGGDPAARYHSRAGRTHRR